ncbi:beta-1,3-N-acetylglucosaminyltransferase [Thermotoga sp. Mc24]|uniref:glycosyltransferase n=1 Tax=Thermotoga sp. Mc24 TaxID=1231241 RepID=UPI000542545B|nr:glycosyltransferase [Thermotoga sp. Mc24]KHC90360.1 beta-1,3-N-acetylglucosaminyltransferase [Thermotoga sp. Mc24]
MARNVGILKASGDYIVFVDSDDTVSPYLVQRIKEVLRKSEYEIIAWKYARKDHRGTELVDTAQFLRLYDDIETTGVEFLQSILSGKMNSYVCTVAIKRSFVVKNNILFTPGAKYGEDLEFLYKCFLLANKVYFVNDYLYYYFINTDSVTNRPADLSILHLYGSTKRLVRFIKGIEKIKNIGEQKETLIRIFESKAYESLIFSVFRIYISNKVNNNIMLQILSNNRIRNYFRNANLMYASRAVRLFRTFVLLFPPHLAIFLRPALRSFMKSLYRAYKKKKLVIP